MIVNSINFWIFFISVFVLYYSVCLKAKNAQNLLLVIASYIFYGIAEWKMIPLLLISTIVYWLLGLWIANNNQKNPALAARLTVLSVILGISILFYFKYLGFFIEEFLILFKAMGFHTNIEKLKILMPLGISFFTFKLISYAIEVHRENIDPCKDIIAFGTYIAFFPTIMAGPIDRPGQFLPQIERNRDFIYNNGMEGARRIVWGMFLKMCIADRLTGYTSAVFGNYIHHNATSLIIASVLYAFEMYTDFAGYSEMAIGVGQLLGIKICENFHRPFFALNVAEYWRRWHMSLTSWLTDYVFLPLNVSFRNIETYGLYFAIVLNLIIVGFWHGANWTYGLFGFYHGLLIVIVTALEKKRKKIEKQYKLKDKIYYKYPRMLLMFISVVLGLVIFRSSTIGEFFKFIRHFSSGFGRPFINATVLGHALPFIAILIFKEWKDENHKNIHFLHSEKTWVCLSSFVLMILSIILAGQLDGGSFIYFQF